MYEKAKYRDAVRVRLTQEQIAWLKTFPSYERTPDKGRSAVIRKALDLYRAQLGA